MKLRTLAMAALAMLPALAAAEPKRARLVATLTGFQVVPGPGDTDGTGTAVIRVEGGQGRLCWDLFVRGTAPPAAAHIHRGAAGLAGPAAIDLGAPDAGGRSRGCAPLDRALRRELVLGAHLLHVDVHGVGGEVLVRGQLRGGPPERVRVRPQPR